MGITDGPSPDDEREELLEALHARIRSTAELPIDRGASRWLGEAEAIAADLARAVEHDDLAESVVERRVEQISELLEEASETGHDGADEYVDAALALSDRILEQL